MLLRETGWRVFAIIYTLTLISLTTGVDWNVKQL